jgi:hypothetical protein
VRRPLFVLSPERRAELQARMGVDVDNLPLGLTEAEKLAASQPGLPDPNWKEKHMETQPLPFLSAKAAAALTVVGLSLGALSGVAAAYWAALLPHWVPFAIAVAGAICLWAAGKSIPGLPVKSPLVSEGVAKAIIALAGSLGMYASSFPPGQVQAGLLLLSSVLGGLAGVTAQQALAPPTVDGVVVKRG